jgi:hypothetical protein
MKINVIFILGIFLPLVRSQVVNATAVTAGMFNGSCMACLTTQNSYQYCNATQTCQILGKYCVKNDTVITTIDKCGDNFKAWRYNHTVCNRNHIITSLDQG